MAQSEQDKLDLAYLNAAIAGDASGVVRCLKAGAGLYARNVVNGWDAMNYALSNLRLDVIRTLVENGYNPNRGADDEHGAPLLVWALSSRLTESVDALVAAGADVSIKNKGNKPPLVFCLENNNTFGISYLMRAGADPEPAIAYIERRSDIKWSGGAPTAATLAHFQQELALREQELAAQRKRDGLACEDAMANGAADVTPLRPLRFKAKPAGFARF